MRKILVWLFGVPLFGVVGLFLFVQVFGFGFLANFGPEVAAKTAEEVGLEVVTTATGLDQPWGMVFLPDGRMLVTEKRGRLRYVSKRGKLSSPIAGLPKVMNEGQGGLLGIALDPDFASNSTVYVSFSETDSNDSSLNGTSVLRARLQGNMLVDKKIIWQQRPKYKSNYHFGSRLVFDRNGFLYVTTGERYSGMQQAQDLSSGFGKIVRITRDGAPAPGNPFAGQDGAQAEIYTYGHRNIQGAALHPQTGVLWAHEHGARGGDEVNIIAAGTNYGWPIITHGIDYSGAKIGEGKFKDGMAQPIHFWDPSIAPSGMTFYTGDKYPGWKGDLLVGSLAHERLVRLHLNGEEVVEEIQLLGDLGERIRDVVQGPDGLVYLLTDSEDGRVLKLVPKG